jgi:hypothetical protein
MASSALIAKKIDDVSYLPVKYLVVSMNIGDSEETTNCVLQTIRYGWDKQNNYDGFMADRKSFTTGRQGTLGELSVDVLSNLQAYNVE